MSLLTSRTSATGVTANLDLIHIVKPYDITQNPSGSSYKATIGQVFNSLSGYCVSNFFVTNIHGCSPLHIQPISGTTIIGEGGGNVGIDIAPNYKFHISGRTSNTELRYVDVANSPYFELRNNNNDDLTFMQVSEASSNSTFGLFFRGFSATSYNEYGKKGDSTLYASVSSNGLNIMKNVTNPTATTKDNYIRFYAGTNAANDNPDVHIQGSGTTRGYVGISTKTPTARLDVSGSTGYNQFRMRTPFTPPTSGDTNGNVGDIAWDTSYLYVKVGVNSWKRASLSGW